MKKKVRTHHKLFRVFRNWNVTFTLLPIFFFLFCVFEHRRLSIYNINANILLCEFQRSGLERITHFFVVVVVSNDNECFTFITNKSTAVHGKNCYLMEVYIKARDLLHVK